MIVKIMTDFLTNDSDCFLDSASTNLYSIMIVKPNITSDIGVRRLQFKIAMMGVVKPNNNIK